MLARRNLAALFLAAASAGVLAGQTDVLTETGKIGGHRVSFVMGADGSAELSGPGMKTAAAKKAGCLGCSGREGVWSPSKVLFERGLMVLEYREADGSYSRVAYARDALDGSPRLASFQKVAVGPDGKTRLTAVDHVSGTRVVRTAGGSDEVCRIASRAAAPFSDLTPEAVSSGSFDPGCAVEPDPVRIGKKYGN